MEGRADSMQVFGWPIRFAEYHQKVDHLAALRQIGDDIGDDCCEALASHGIAVGDFLGDMHSFYATDDRLAAFIDSVTMKPDWLDKEEDADEIIRRGQLMFWKYSSTCLMGLLYFSLIGGFAAPKIIKTLDETKYITKSNNTWKRLNETLEMVIDCMETNALNINGAGFKSVLKVRLLHSKVRLMIRKSSHWDQHADNLGIPINQEEMAATLLSFSINILETLRLVGAPVSPADKASYLFIWRYIGYLIGIKEEFNPCLSYDYAGGYLESIVMHLLTPDKRSREVVSHVLQSVANRPPLRWSFACHSEACRYLLGSSLSDELDIQRGGVLVWAYIKFVFLILYIMNHTVFNRITSLNSPFIRKKRQFIRGQIAAAVK